MTDRDLVVLTLAIAVSVTIGVFDYVIDLAPGPNDAILNTAFVLAVAWGFYRLGPPRR